MKTLTSCTVIPVILGTLALTFQAAPSNAMGRSGSPSQKHPQPAEVTQKLGKMELEQKEMQTSVQSQLADLRKELDDLRKELAASKGALLAP